MSILVTGGAGYIGSHMCWLLEDTGEPFVVLDDLSTGKRNLPPKTAPFVQGDVGDAELLDQVMKDNDIDSVIHFAGSIIVPESVELPLKYYDNNTSKSRTLIEACVRNGVKNFIFSSTAAVYGEPKLNPVPESAPFDSQCPYATSKLMTEMILKDTAIAHDINYVALRYFNVAGADLKKRTGQSSPNATHLIKLASLAALGKRPALQITGDDYPTPDGTGVRDYIHVMDLAEAHLLALNYLRDKGASIVLNCGYGRGYSVLEVIGALEEVIERSLPVERAPRRPGDVHTLVADSSAIKEKFGWKPKLDDLHTIVRTAFEWETRLHNQS